LSDVTEQSRRAYGTVKDPGKRNFFTSRGRLLGIVGFIGVTGIVGLLAAMLGPGNGSNAPRQADTAIGKVLTTSNPSAISAIPNSLAIVKDPSKASSSAQGERSAGGDSKKLSTGPSNALSDVSGSADSTSKSGPITTGNSKTHCITLNFPSGVLEQSIITAATNLTGVTYNCISSFANPVATWAGWETPWMFSDSADGWDSWLGASSAHQVIVGMDLIPQSVSDNSDPLTWEQACASGGYDQYATTLATNLVSYGAGDIVIRLGVEANGTWEDDYVGSTATEMSDWAKCFDNEVTSMRAVPGAHFLFVWNPNVCTDDLPLNEWYPGNSYVDIIGVDAYDKDCLTLNTVSTEGWTTYSTDSSGNTPNDPNFPSLANIEAFATANGKPLSFPEWAIYSGTSDDATYVTDIAQMINRDNFSFEAYYDTGGNGIAMLGSAIPNATGAYSQAFK
jgi:hypothetical protein